MTSQFDRDHKLRLQPPASTAPFLIPAAAKIPGWRFAVPLLLQTALILAVPAQAVYIHLTGTTIFLQTAPVDPYDLFRGYSVVLGYDISNPAALQNLPGWETIRRPVPGAATVPNPELLPGTHFYLVLEAPRGSSGQGPQPWQPVQIHRDRPSKLAANQVVLKGRSANGFSVEYGLETYYIPEEQREQINREIAQPNLENAGKPAIVEAKVDAQGNAIPIRIWVNHPTAAPGQPSFRQYHF